jgi:hypothetical protein
MYDDKKGPQNATYHAEFRILLPLSKTETAKDVPVILLYASRKLLYQVSAVGNLSTPFPRFETIVYEMPRAHVCAKHFIHFTCNLSRTSCRSSRAGVSCQSNTDLRTLTHSRPSSQRYRYIFLNDVEHSTPCLPQYASSSPLLPPNITLSVKKELYSSVIKVPSFPLCFSQKWRKHSMKQG